MTKILYVDDDSDNLVVFDAMCAGQFEVCTAASGEHALEILAQQEIAVLLADQRMPGMTGVELAERASKEHPDVVRILVTAFSDLSEAIDAINRGQIRGYLRKPWDQDELLATMREALATYATRKRVRDLELHMLATERVYTLGVVTAGIAHELKSPLTMLSEGVRMVQARLESVRTQIANADTEEALRLLDTVEPFLNAQRDSTDAMIDTCRGFEVANHEQDPNERCNLEEVAGTASRIALASRRGESPLAMKLGPVSEVVGNPHRLGRVIINLLVNAFDVLVDDPDGAVELRLFEEGDEVVLEVEDNGAGMDEKARARVFEVFFSTKSQGGTGLGLAMSKTIVEEVNGTLECESELGGGAVFRMRLAAVRE
jgi:signal transduction histidine kinase